MASGEGALFDGSDTLFRSVELTHTGGDSDASTPLDAHGSWERRAEDNSLYDNGEWIEMSAVAVTAAPHCEDRVIATRVVPVAWQRAAAAAASAAAAGVRGGGRDAMSI